MYHPWLSHRAAEGRIMHSSTELYTERLVLRPFHDEDAEALYLLARDPAVGPAAGWPVHKDPEDSLQIIRNVLSVRETYAIVRREDQALLGSISLKDIQDEDYLDADRHAELGYWLGVPHWGHGYMQEAGMRMLQRGFDELQLDYITCGYYEGNERSAHVQKALGFVYDHKTDNTPVPLLHDVRAEIWQVLLKSMYLQNSARRKSRMQYQESSYRIYRKEPDGTISAEIEFPEITRGEYRITRLFVAPRWEGQGVRSDLLAMALKRIQERGGTVSSKDPAIRDWIDTHRQ